LHDQLIDIFI